MFQRQTVAMKTLVLCCVCLLAGVGEAVKSTGDEVAALKSRVAILARQLVMQQLFVEERVRSDGDSGVKQVR